MNFITMLSLILATSLSSFANFSPYPGFERLPENHIEMVNFFEARKLALVYLQKVEKADQEFSEGERKVFGFAREKLIAARVYFSANPLNSSCRDTRGYVDQKIKDTIFICEAMRKDLQEPSKDLLQDLAQDLLHEVAHLLGTDDECTATNFELMIMKSAVGNAKPTSLNAYGEQCGGFNEYRYLTKNRHGADRTSSTSDKSNKGSRSSR